MLMCTISTITIFQQLIAKEKTYFYKRQRDEKTVIIIFKNYLFLAALGLRCCAQVFSSCGEWGLLLVVVRGLLIAVASLVAENGL